jgi:hypothetical protein
MLRLSVVEVRHPNPPTPFTRGGLQKVCHYQMRLGKSPSGKWQKSPFSKGGFPSTKEHRAMKGEGLGAKAAKD